MGISHAVLIWQGVQRIYYDPINGTRPVNAGARAGARSGALAGVPFAPQQPARSRQPETSDDDTIIDEFQFQVKFAYRPVAVEDRVDLSELEPDPETGIVEEPPPADDSAEP
jgi:hypothetical protein